MDLATARYVVLDVETTGLDPQKGHRVCEVGAIRIHRGKEDARFQTLVQPDREMDPQARAQHGITDEELEKAPRFREIAAKLRSFLAGSVLVAQNAAFDLSFLNAEFVRAGMPPLASPAVDTIPLARKVRPGLKGYNLDSLARNFGLEFRERHRSIGDCEVTAEVFLRCLNHLDTHGHVRTLQDLLRTGSFKRPRSRPSIPDA